MPGTECAPQISILLLGSGKSHLVSRIYVHQVQENQQLLLQDESGEAQAAGKSQARRRRQHSLNGLRTERQFYMIQGSLGHCGHIREVVRVRAEHVPVNRGKHRSSEAFVLSGWPRMTEM